MTPSDTVTTVIQRVFNSVINGHGFAGVLETLAARNPDVYFTMHSQCAHKNDYYFLETYNVSGDVLEDFWEVAHENPFPRVVLETPFSTIADSRKHIPEDLVERTDFFDHVLKKRGDHNRALGVPLHKDGADVGFLGALVPKGYRNKQQDILATELDLTRPYLQCAFRLLLELNKRKALAASRDDWINRIPAMALLVDTDLKLHAVNAKANAFLGNRGENRTARNGELILESRKDHQSLCHLVSYTCSRRTPSQPIYLSAENGPGKVVFAIPIAGQRATPFLVQPFLKSQPRVLLLVFDPTDTPKSSTRLLQLSLGLTERESAVVQKLIDGLNLRETSEALGITYNTARNHIAAATDKTGANSQTAVVKMGTQILSRSSSDNVSIECRKDQP